MISGHATGLGGLLVIAVLAGAGGNTSSAPVSSIESFADGPPARVTGGFGEDSCIACHFGAEENDDLGELRVLGLPEVFSAGETYSIEFELARTGIATAGFQLAMRHREDETQAGEFRVPSKEEHRVGILSDRGVDFVHHLRPGSEPIVPDTVKWTVLWTAPMDIARVSLHLAAVAGDGDDSQFGDHVYTYEANLARR